jgi:hypothetical protein
MAKIAKTGVHECAERIGGLECKRLICLVAGDSGIWCPDCGAENWKLVSEVPLVVPEGMPLDEVRNQWRGTSGDTALAAALREYPDAEDVSCEVQGDVFGYMRWLEVRSKQAKLRLVATKHFTPIYRDGRLMGSACSDVDWTAEAWS